MLAEVQSWMQKAIVHAGSDARALAGAGRHVRPSRTLEPGERLGIYRGMYLLRMRDALAVDYPGLQHYFGDQGFERFIAAYVAKHPSRGYTLNRLGDSVPQFLRRWRGADRREFLYELARTELAMTEVFDAEETRALTKEQIAAVPPGQWAGKRLVPIAALRLLELRYPAPLYLEAVREEQKPPVMRPRRSCVVYYRRDYGLLRIDLAPSAYRLLSLLVRGTPLGAAVEQAWLASKPRVREEQLFAWFQQWISEGLFRAVE